jgi:hypothetical protein
MSISAPPAEPAPVDRDRVREADPLIRAVLSAPPLRRDLIEEEREALDEYLRKKGLLAAR